MASSYGGVSFFMLAEEQDNTLKRPWWAPEDFGTQRQKIPFANVEQLQFTGRGNRRLKVKIEMYDDEAFETLLLMVGTGSPRTLNTEWGEVYTNVYLVDMQNVWRVTFQEEIHADLTFEIIG